MKKFIKIFVCVFILEITFGILSNVYDDSAFNLLEGIGSLPLSLINKTYPYYAEGSNFFRISLLLVNVYLKAVFINSLLKRRSAPQKN